VAPERVLRAFAASAGRRRRAALSGGNEIMETVASLGAPRLWHYAQTSAFAFPTMH